MGPERYLASDFEDMKGIVSYKNFVSKSLNVDDGISVAAFEDSAAEDGDHWGIIAEAVSFPRMSTKNPPPLDKLKAPPLKKEVPVGRGIFNKRHSRDSFFTFTQCHVTLFKQLICL